ncbi:MAG TPA: hypothetical protein VFM42_02655, partial [Sphingomicrobium sp.]|nr:hypothetical protein [Sphingomicrobium sp.]
CAICATRFWTHSFGPGPFYSRFRRALPALDCPFHDKAVAVTTGGRMGDGIARGECCRQRLLRNHPAFAFAGAGPGGEPLAKYLISL